LGSPACLLRPPARCRVFENPAAFGFAPIKGALQSDKEKQKRLKAGLFFCFVFIRRQHHAD
jgi:hypothetical protein